MAKTTILLVEDDVEDYNIIRMLLPKKYTLFHYGSLDKIEKNITKLKNIDLILLDLSLPSLSSNEILSIMMNMFVNTPIIVLNQTSNIKLALSLLALGAQDYLVKNQITKESLLMSIRYSIQRFALIYKLQGMGTHDILTRLPNKAYFFKSLSQTILRNKRKKNKDLFAILFIDLDDFKEVNDTLGHLNGDLLLQKIAEYLQPCIREEDLLSRFGGDEFVLLANDLRSEKDIHLLANRILNKVKQPITIGNQEIYTSASIGIALSNMKYKNQIELVKHADSALYESKKKRKGSYTIFNNSIYLEKHTKFILEEKLKQAMSRREFILYYQPIISLDSMQIDSLEALIRWKPYNENTVLTPDTFISVLEENKVIVDLGYWVVEQVCSQIQSWANTILKDIIISINVSLRQFSDPHFVNKFTAILKKYNIKENALQIELKASILKNNIDNIVVTLTQLRKLGLKIVLDNFGVGYFSLINLKKLPIDIIKIDKFFISETPDIEIIKIILAIAKILNIGVIAEGIETKEQLKFFTENNCKLAQGYYFQKPISPIEIKNIFHHQGDLQDEIKT